MRLLLDTHVFLWAAAEPALLSSVAREAIEDRNNDVFVSSAVAWEIALKHRLGKLTLPHDPELFVPAGLAALGFRELAITGAHGLATSALPGIHADPFDRIMLAQAKVEKLTLVSRDANIWRYDTPILRA